MQIRKASGETISFSPEKLKQSLKQSGADPQTIDTIVETIKGKLYEGITTKEIYQEAHRLLRKNQKTSAAKYGLKGGLMDLGPTGYPFEQFVGKIFREKDYQVTYNVMRKGHCIQHELDVILSKEAYEGLLECKFHNYPGSKSTIQEALYLKARFDDIAKFLQFGPVGNHWPFEGWLVTNTKFSEDVCLYSQCEGLSLLGWDYPKNEGLKDMIDQSGLYPVTCLTTLRKKDKQVLLEKDIVTAKELLGTPAYLDQLNLSRNKKERIIQEAELLVFS